MLSGNWGSLVLWIFSSLSCGGVGKSLRFTAKGFLFFIFSSCFSTFVWPLPLREADIGNRGCKVALWKEDLVKDEVRSGVDLKGTSFV